MITNSAFLENDVTLLLKDITGLVEPQPAEERERLIQSGVSYCEMLPIEYTPSEAYFEEYVYALDNFSRITAFAVQTVAEKILAKKGKNVVLVSLARAGITVGVLIKRYLYNKYKINAAHYALSIIRGMGIDNNAVKYVLERHNPENIQFVDGWTGKGAISGELAKETARYAGLSPELAVICDPAGITPLCGTHEDFLIASSCLNCTVSGLISRTFYRRDIIADTDFHGAMVYGELRDMTYEFISRTESLFDYKTLLEADEIALYNGIVETAEIAEDFGIGNINLIKPSVGETTRVLLRRVPEVVLIAENAEEKFVAHIVKLAEDKGVRVVRYPLRNYRAVGIIKNIADL
ncbi:hypothetical protein AGMMS49975_07340 [Clostridia bacterium]|nr:hypothetical protein AGMMS49975_07340 [Clostridia bacterium]